MIWQDEIIKDRRKREWRAFYLGAVTALVLVFFGALWFAQLTKGEGCEPVSSSSR